MLAEQFATAAHQARTLAHTDNLAKQVWKAWGEGHLSDSAAEAISRVTEERRAALKQARVPNYRGQFRTAVRRSVSPDRRKSISRRRKNSASGLIPVRLAAHFTQGETSVLTVVAREVQKHGNCSLPIDQIAALAGVCRTVVQTAMREAERLCLVTVQQRRRAGRPSLTNVVRIVGQEWRMWLRLGGKGAGVQKSKPHVITDSYKQEPLPDTPLVFTVRSNTLETLIPHSKQEVE